jgi:dihydroneopterin aldolase
MTSSDDASPRNPFTADRITLAGIEVFAHHGVHQFERDYGQKFVIDVTVALSLAAAGTTDDLSKTLNYGELARQVEVIVKTDPADLIETVAERISAAVLEHPLATAVEVTVHKPQAPLTMKFTDVSVTIVRSR